MPEPHLSAEAQRFEYRRAERNRQAAAVGRALERHPFDERYQVAEPMEPNCEICLVVPAYDEGANILPLLFSLAHQTNIRPDQFEVVVVVNNTADATIQNTTEYQSNQMTLRLLQALEKGTMPTLYSGNVQLEAGDEYYDWFKQQVDDIIATQLRIRHIDLSSSGQAPAVNNVGVARDVGGWEAVRRFYGNQQLDGLVMTTDADCRLEPTTLADTRAVFWRSHVDHVGGSGGRTVEHNYPTVAELEARLLQKLTWELRGVLEQIEACQHPNQPAQLSAADFFAGAHTAVRMDAYALSGGIPHLSGGEDTYFGLRLEKLGRVAFLPTNLRTEFRPSQRTDPAAGYGWGVERALQRQADPVPVSESLDYRLAETACIEAIAAGQSFTDFSATQPQLSEYIGQTLYEQMLALQPEAADGARYPEAAQALIRLERLNLRQALVKHFPDQPIDTLAVQVEQYVQTALPEHWKTLNSLLQEALHRQDETRRLFLGLFAAVEALHASLTEEQQQLLDQTVTAETAAILGPVMMAWWQQHGEQYGQTMDIVESIRSEGGLEKFVGVYLRTPWKMLNAHQHDPVMTLTAYALRAQDATLLPDSVIHSSSARIQALASSLRQLAGQLRNSS